MVSSIRKNAIRERVHRNNHFKISSTLEGLNRQPKSIFRSYHQSKFENKHLTTNKRVSFSPNTSTGMDAQSQ